MYKNWIVFSLITIFLGFSCTPKMHLAKVNDSTIKFEKNTNIEPSAELESIIKPYRNQLGDKMNEVLCLSAKDLTKKRVESTLGNWVCDALMHQAEERGLGPIDFTVQNYGGLRISAIAEGPVTVGKIYELMPFDNELVILELDGTTTLELMNRIAAYGGWPCSAGIKMEFNDDGVGKLRLHGKEIQKSGTYKIGMPDYIANGGDKFDFLIEQKRSKTGLLIRDLLIAECKLRGDKGEHISANIDSRMVKK